MSKQIKSHTGSATSHVDVIGIPVHVEVSGSNLTVYYESNGDDSATHSVKLFSANSDIPDNAEFIPNGGVVGSGASAKYAYTYVVV